MKNLTKPKSIVNIKNSEKIEICPLSLVNLPPWLYVHEIYQFSKFNIFNIIYLTVNSKLGKFKIRKILNKNESPESISN